MEKKNQTETPRRRPLYVPFEVREQGNEKTRFSEEDILRQEQNFIKTYSNPKAKPLKILFSLYKGHYHHLFCPLCSSSSRPARCGFCPSSPVR